MKCKYCGDQNCDSDSCMWKAVKESRQQEKWDNDAKSISMLIDNGFDVQTLNKGISHYRVNGVDFWATTGKFIDNKTGKKGRGVFDLIKYIQSMKGADEKQTN